MPFWAIFYHRILRFSLGLVLIFLTGCTLNNISSSSTVKPVTETPTAQQAASGKATKVNINSFDWNGEIPVSRLVVVKNPYGSIRSRNHQEEKVFYHVAIQEIGDSPIKPRFDIQQKDGRLYIEVVYDEPVLDQAGNLRGRTDVSVLFPDTVGIYAETDAGFIKIDKTASHIEAVSRTGNISLNTTGLFRAETQSGDVSLQMRGFVQHGNSSAQSANGIIKATIFDDMAVSVQAQTNAKVLLNGDKQNNGLVYQKGQQPLSVYFSSYSGDIILETVAPPELLSSRIPSKANVVNINLGDLPNVAPWKPGDPIFDRDDKKNHENRQ
ncbi:MAG: hypothetical protein ACI808_001705 [Paraglaciecola sp.]|jgi:hypothetical protein